MRASRVSPAVVVGSYAYLEAAKLHKVTRLYLAQLHTAGGDRLEQPARACWGDEISRRWEQSE
jgi:hypothetical protein